MTTDNQQNISTDDKLVMVDRVTCIATMFQQLIIEHAAAKLLKDDITKLWFSIGDLFNRACEIHYRALCDAPGNPPGYTPPHPKYRPVDLTRRLSPVVDYQEEINVGHRHELMDRSYCLSGLFKELVLHHPASRLFDDRASKIGNMFGDLYQAAAKLYLA